MNPKTLIIDFVPEAKKETPSFLRNKKYAEDLLNSHDLGEVIVCGSDTYKDLLAVHNPFIIIVAYEYIAQEIKTLKPDALVYLTVSTHSIFSKKAEMEEKKEKQKKVFKEIQGIINKIRESSDEERQSIRKFAAMDYNDMYKMIQKALISEDDNLRKQAWDLLFGEGEKHKDFIWMRVQLMAEIWEHAKGETLEQLMLMSMERHIDQGTARKMDNFTDLDGLEYHQYMFLDPLGNDTKHIRRLPFATKGQDRYAYENLLEKNEIPTNYLRIQVEANSLRKQWDDYLAGECEKVKKVLEEWNKDPSKSKKELGVVPWNETDSPNDPLTEKEFNSLRGFFERYNLP